VPARRGSILLAVCVLGLLGSPLAHAALPRADADLPDDAAGPQVHVVYAVAGDVTDRELDTGGEIGASVESWQRWLRGETGGKGLRLDTYQGQLDVTFFRLAATSAAAAALPVATIAPELRAAGFASPDKLYAVYYDGASTASCGSGGGAYPSVYLTGSDSRSGTSCEGPFGQSPPAYLDFALLHEVVHSLGYVPPCAPHSTPTEHVGDSSYDLMWGNGPWGSLADMALDVGHDDYFEARLPGCPDLSGSRFLEGGGATLTVTVAAEAAAAGSVTVSAGGQPLLACSAGSCARTFDSWPPQALKLTAEPGSATDELAGWSGACGGAAETCTLTLDASKDVVATFAPKPPVSLTIETDGAGRVTSSPDGISCPARCSASFPYATAVFLRPVPSNGWRFAGWSETGDCSRLEVPCEIVLSGPTGARATFVPRDVAVRVAIAGRGRVASTPAAIACPGRCAGTFPYGTRVRLRAVPAHGWRFAAWAGSCSGRRPCPLVLTATTADRRVRARFERVA
jgi:List-Bact-rpt repeat protein